MSTGRLWGLRSYKSSYTPSWAGKEGWRQQAWEGVNMVFTGCARRLGRLGRIESAEAQLATGDAGMLRSVAAKSFKSRCEGV